MVAYEKILEQLGWRYAVKKFNPEKKLNNEQVDQVLEAMRLAPSSYGLQPWRFVVITNEELRQKMRAVSYDQSQVTDASHLVVIAHSIEIVKNDIDRYISSIAKVRNIEESEMSGFGEAMKGDILERTSADQSAWASRQAYIALGFGLETSALLGIDACPMEGFQSSAVSEILELDKKGYRAVVCLALGYRSEEDSYADKIKVRFMPEEIIDWMV